MLRYAKKWQVLIYYRNIPVDDCLPICSVLAVGKASILRYTQLSCTMMIILLQECASDHTIYGVIGSPPYFETEFGLRLRAEKSKKFSRQNENKSN